MARSIPRFISTLCLVAGVSSAAIPAFADRNFSYDYLKLQTGMERYSNGPDLWAVSGELSTNVWNGLYLQGRVSHAEGDNAAQELERSAFTGMLGYAHALTRYVDGIAEAGFTYEDMDAACGPTGQKIGGWDCQASVNDTSLNVAIGIRAWASDHMELRASVGQVGGVHTRTELQAGLAAWLDHHSAITMDFHWEGDQNALLLGYRYSF